MAGVQKMGGNMFNHNDGEICSLNETILAELSIEELESRLQMEELDPRGEMWTGCGCAEDVCPSEWVCPPEKICMPKDVW